MNKFLRFLAVLILSGGFFFAFSGRAAADADRNLIIIADWGSKGPSAGMIEALARYPSVRLAVAWPSGLKPAEGIKNLVNARRLEPVMTLSDEPVLPLLTGVCVSSSSIPAGWPEDVRDIIARGQESYRGAFGHLSAGLFLRSGAFTQDAVPLLSRMSVRWAVVPAHRNDGGKAFAAGRFIMFSPHVAGPGFSLLEWLASRREKDIVLLFDAANPITVEQIESLGEILPQNGSIRMLLPQDVFSDHEGIAVRVETLPIDDPGAQAWLQNPVPWERVMMARRALEEYKNSGEARSHTVELAREELYHLYRYDTLAANQKGGNPEEEQTFLAGVGNVYRLIGKPVPDENAVPAAVDNIPVSPETGLQTESLPDRALFMVLSPDPRALAIRRFSVQVTSETVTYTVNVASAMPSGDFHVDVYMDLNNLRNAGLNRLLPGVEGYLQEENAWEYALRFDRYQVSLYRAGRYDPVLSRTFRLARRFEVSIPRAILRGNPLHWGYQVITMEKKDVAAPWQVNDFLAQDASSRALITRRSPLQLPAFRTK